ncbi:MAG: NUDIX domain-containing protein [Dehalococcoidales bacterium]|nr:NUDIX domain-containing protein [Dehalococcoidales bacterium]
MEKAHRISAGAIIFKEDRILLVRYNNTYGKNFLVEPGGGILGNEGIYRALIRAGREETGIEVSPHSVLFVEDWLSRHS